MQTKFAGNLTLKMQAFSGNPCLTHCGFDSLTFYLKKTARMQFFAGAGGGNLTLKMQAFSGNPCLTHVGSTPPFSCFNIFLILLYSDAN